MTVLALAGSCGSEVTWNSQPRFGASTSAGRPKPYQQPVLSRLLQNSFFRCELPTGETSFGKEIKGNRRKNPVRPAAADRLTGTQAALGRQYRYGTVQFPDPWYNLPVHFTYRYYGCGEEVCTSLPRNRGKRRSFVPPEIACTCMNFFGNLRFLMVYHLL